MSRASGIGFILLAAIVARPMGVLACEVCACTFNASASEGTQLAGPMIITPSTQTLGKGHGSVGLLFEHQRYNAIPAEDAHMLHEDGRDVHGKRHEEVYNVSLGYGMRDNLDVFLTVPVVSRTSAQIHDEDHLDRRERASGFGDLRLMGKYRFLSDGANAALLLGVKAPTGETSRTDQSGMKFGPEGQPGSGAWDLTGGLAVSRSFAQRLTVASAFQYSYRGEGAQDLKFGDVSRYDLGCSYALRPLGTRPNLSLVVELHHQWMRRDHSRESAKVLDSGGTTILLSPGVSAAITESLSVFWAMPIPIYQHMGGEHEELVYEVISGMAWRF